MHYVVAVHLSPGGTKTEHITNVIWVNATTYTSGESPTASMVEFVEKNPGKVKVTDGKSTSTVEVVTSGKSKYLRSERTHRRPTTF